ncbi:hypothetical protein RAH41_22030 [Gottfriedia acidiceleris]|uniref:hypothetical protein n=1 Tax=Gottfriedia acidiceleris TaxID=371036 RepID=UPI002F26DC03
MKKNTVYLNILLIFILVFALSCSHKKQDNMMALIFTSFSKNKSSIKFYNENFQMKKEININYGGIGKGKKYNNHYYLPITGTPFSAQNKILNINLKSNEIRYIDTFSKPIDLVKLNNYLYVIHNSELRKGKVSKINLKNNKIVKEISLKGVLKKIACINDEIVVVGDDVEGLKQKIYFLTTNLKTKNKIVNEKTAFPTDIALNGSLIYVINNAKNDFSGPTNQIIQIDKKTKKSKLVELNFLGPWEIFFNKRSTYITQYDFSNKTGSRIQIIDESNNTRKLLKLNNDPILSKLDNKHFYSSDNKGMYIYDIQTFKLTHSMTFKDKDHTLIDFILKEEETK